MSLSQKLSIMNNELNQLQDREVQFQVDLQQHQRVLETIKSYDPNRKCYRLVGEILVQSTIAETKPLLENQEANLKELVKTYHQKVEAKEQEIIQFQKDNHIRIESARSIQEGK